MTTNGALVTIFTNGGLGAMAIFETYPAITTKYH